MADNILTNQSNPNLIILPSNIADYGPNYPSTHTNFDPDNRQQMRIIIVGSSGIGTIALTIRTMTNTTTTEENKPKKKDYWKNKIMEQKRYNGDKSNKKRKHNKRKHNIFQPR